MGFTRRQLIGDVGDVLKCSCFLADSSLGGSSLHLHYCTAVFAVFNE